MMTMLVVELYDQTNQAEEAIEMLENEGIDRAEIEKVDPSNRKEREQGFFKRLFRRADDAKWRAKDLARMGLPREDAQMYTEEVHRGRTLLVVRCGDEESGYIRDLLTNAHSARQRDMQATGGVRQRDMNIEEYVAGVESKPGRFEQFESDLRKHYDENYARRGEPGQFDDYSMAYRYGIVLGEGPSLGKSWAELEPGAREEWEAHYQGTWDVYHDAVVYGFQRIRGLEGEEWPNVSGEEGRVGRITRAER